MTEACESLLSRGFINYYGLQRFGKGAAQSHEVGRSILKGDWKLVVNQVLLAGEIDVGDALEAKQLYAQGRIHAAKSKAQKARNMIVERNVLEGLCRYTL